MAAQYRHKWTKEQRQRFAETMAAKRAAAESLPPPQPSQDNVQILALKILAAILGVK